jgi:hypothetical protein
MKSLRLACAVGAAAVLMAGGANAASLIVNGGFETGDLTGWTPNVEVDSAGGLFVEPTGSSGPISSLPTQTNPNGQNFFAMSDQGGPGSYSLTQSFTIGPKTTNVVVSFDLFANNYDGGPFPGRDFKAGAVQNVEVDVLTGGADPFTTDPNDIVAVLYGPGADAGANPNPWTSYSVSLGTLPVGTYLIRFAETDNQAPLTMGVDNVSITATPEPSTWAMMIAGFAGLGLIARRRRAALAA